MQSERLTSIQSQDTNSRPEIPQGAPKGRILFIGTSYYNNWYLSRELRKHGYEADLLVYANENTGPYLHGTDFALEEYLQWDSRYPESVFVFMKNLLHAYVQCKVSENGNRERQPQHRVARLPIQALGGYLESRPSRLERLVRRAVSTELEPSAGPLLTGLAALKKAAAHVISRPLTNMLLQILCTCRDRHQRVLKHAVRLLLDSCRERFPAELNPLFNVLDRYDIVHFTGVNNIRYFHFFSPWLFGYMPIQWDIQLLKLMGKKIVYSNTSCMDGVTQTSYRSWSSPPVCDICSWRDNRAVCSDEGNLAWGRLRNDLADYVITIGGNRVDCNNDPKVHEVPEFYCLDPDVWDPNLAVPPKFTLSSSPETVKVFHAVGNSELRTRHSKNIKCTHIYIPTIERLRAEGYKVELLFFSNVPNTQLRYYQVQTDIFVDMLTFGFYGATAREGMMLGKPVICYLRPDWLDSMRREIPEFVDELPIVSATPQTVYDVLKDLVENPEKRREIGARSREFAVRWHSAKSGARRLEEIYSELLKTGKTQRNRQSESLQLSH